jgi:hypothetical protein
VTNIPNTVKNTLSMNLHQLALAATHTTATATATHLFSTPLGKMRRRRMTCKLRHILSRHNANPIGR